MQTSEIKSGVLHQPWCSAMFHMVLRFWSPKRLGAHQHGHLKAREVRERLCEKKENDEKGSCVIAGWATAGHRRACEGYREPQQAELQPATGAPARRAAKWEQGTVQVPRGMRVLEEKKDKCLKTAEEGWGKPFAYWHGGHWDVKTVWAGWSKQLSEAL